MNVTQHSLEHNAHYFVLSVLSHFKRIKKNKSQNKNPGLTKRLRFKNAIACVKTNNNIYNNNNRTLHIALKTSAAKMYVKCEYCYFRGQSGTPFSNSSRSMALALFFKLPISFLCTAKTIKQN